MCGLKLRPPGFSAFGYAGPVSQPLAGLHDASRTLRTCIGYKLN